MVVEFEDADLAELEQNTRSTAGHGDAVDRGFRKVMQLIRSAFDERDFYGMRSLHFEKLKGKRSHQYSMRINQQWRLIVELRNDENRKRLAVIAIEDYH
jgi:proteic killer suppression protein